MRAPLLLGAVWVSAVHVAGEWATCTGVLALVAVVAGLAAPDRFKRLLALDRVLARHGFPPLSPWWIEQLQRWYTHPTARTLIACVGRGGAKSTTGAKVAVVEALFGPWQVPAGERHSEAITSVERDEASTRANQVEAKLRALGVAHDRVGDVIRLQDQPRDIRVMSCTVVGQSGFRAFGAFDDETAKWKSSTTGTNPAAEVLASQRAMMVSHPEARTLMVSSPWSQTDHFAELLRRGDTDAQLIATAPTWIANPTITEQRTRELEPDERIWRREYVAEPQASAMAAFEPEDVEAAFARGAA